MEHPENLDLEGSLEENLEELSDESLETSGTDPEEEAPNFFESLGKLNFEDEEGTGKFFGKIFSNVNKTIKKAKELPNTESTQDIVNFVFNAIGLPSDMRDEYLKQAEIRAYFMEQLHSVGMKNAIVATKEHFDLPDDFSLKIEHTVVFNVDV